MHTTQNNMSTHYWTGSNNSTYLRTIRAAKNKLAATRAALNYLRGELMGEGKVMIFDNDDRDSNPIIIFKRSIHTGYRLIRQEEGKPQRTMRL